ncbi:MAG: hypothetical protein CNLJKLNK_01198 [Holosporales bacterium]
MKLSPILAFANKEGKTTDVKFEHPTKKSFGIPGSVIPDKSSFLKATQPHKKPVPICLTKRNGEKSTPVNARQSFMKLFPIIALDSNVGKITYSKSKHREKKSSGIF